ncbi:hypothetical protein LTS16_025643 [Friedmanniomyces endolithicus]|nr:hypothetical protein LTR57_023374 [Friedmanniomyces endolithicus]KAK0973964.1 hypothetical protein LTS01_014384 [Friedmanniomyces endolithicus]KAK1022526.1 hypothetical protein LTS16_025643 [Friedmanniomyces endolithicus]
MHGLEGVANTQNTTAKAPSPAPAILQTSRLLTLPAEIRNSIYDLILVREGRKRVLAPALPYEPAFLRTCRQIRGEAQGIFLHQNEFYITVYNLHYTIPRTHWLHSVAPQNRSVVLARSTQKMQWEHLRDWLKAYHAGEAARLPVPERYLSPDMHQVAARAFQVVERLGGGVKWEVVGEALVDLLEHYRGVGRGFRRGLWTRTRRHRKGEKVVQKGGA